MSSRFSSQIVFVTGTDTGVGKTVLTGLLACHWKETKVKIRAVKPVCCGGRQDLDFLHKMQGGKGSSDSLCAAYFPRPIAPGAMENSALKTKATTRFLKQWIEAQARKVDLLLVEGCGGLLVPLNRRETVLDLIEALNCPVILVAPNRVGVINHTLLSIKALECHGRRQGVIVLMGQKRNDPSVRSNRLMLERWGGGWPVVEVPYLGKRAMSSVKWGGNAVLKKSLARLKGSGIFVDVLLEEAVE